MGVFRELHCLVSVCTRTVTLTFDCQEDEQTPRTDPGPSHVDRFAPCPGAAERAPGVSRRPLWSQVGPQLPSGCQRDIASHPLFRSIGALLGAPFPGLTGTSLRAFPQRSPLSCSSEAAFADRAGRRPTGLRCVMIGRCLPRPIPIPIPPPSSCPVPKGGVPQAGSCLASGLGAPSLRREPQASHGISLRLSFLFHKMGILTTYPAVSAL